MVMDFCCCFPEDPDKLREEATEYLKAFDEQETEQMNILKRSRDVPDEDGFVTVTRYIYRHFSLFSAS